MINYSEKLIQKIHTSSASLKYFVTKSSTLICSRYLAPRNLDASGSNVTSILSSLIFLEKIFKLYIFSINY
jgi:hypothetical protein